MIKTVLFFNRHFWPGGGGGGFTACVKHSSVAPAGARKLFVLADEKTKLPAK